MKFFVAYLTNVLYLILLLGTLYTASVLSNDSSPQDICITFGHTNNSCSEGH